MSTRDCIAPLGAGQPPGGSAFKYSHKRIGWELERTAMGDGFYGNALRVAKDIPGITAEERSVLDRYAEGRHCGTDHVALQEIAMKIYNASESAGLLEGDATVLRIAGCINRHLGGALDQSAVMAAAVEIAAFAASQACRGALNAQDMPVDEVQRDAAGETWMGMPVAAYQYTQPLTFPGGCDGAAAKMHTAHWSTGPDNSERLYRESDIRDLLVSCGILPRKGGAG